MGHTGYFDILVAAERKKKAPKYFVTTKEKKAPVSRTHRKCSDCHLIKEMHKFPVSKNAYLGRTYRCYKCTGVVNRERKLRLHPPKPRVLKPKKTHEEKHEEKLAAEARYRDLNRQRLRDNMRTWANIPYNRLWQSLKARIMRHTQSQPYSISKKDIGLFPVEFQSYIEGLWKPGMSWDNYGHRGAISAGWVVRFIRPASQTNWEDYQDYRRVIHYTNLEPAWWVDVSGERRVFSVSNIDISMMPNARIIYNVS